MNKLVRKLNTMRLNGNNNRNKRKRNRRNRNVINKLPPILSKYPQRYGAGSTIRYISFSYTVAATSVSTFNIGTDIADNQEFNEIAVNYSYCRLLAIKVIVRPFNYTNTTSVMFLKMNWSNATETAQSIVNSDVSKMVGSVNPKGAVFTFLPPSISYGGAAIPNFYVQSLANNYIFVLNASSAFTTPIPINVEVAIKFRTPRDYSQTNETIKKLKQQIIDEIKNIQKLEKDQQIKELNELNINEVINKNELKKINNVIMEENSSEEEDVNKIKNKKKKKNKKNEDIKEE